MHKKPKIFALGENALTIEFSDKISVYANDSAISLADYAAKNPFPGFVESVPAYASTTIFYDLYMVRKNFPQFPTAFFAVKDFAETALQKSPKKLKMSGRTIEIPVSFDEKHALDLDFVAESNNLSREKVIELFTAKTYRVYMLGFLPGFAYMGEVDARIATPRKSSPRTKMSKGSVGIAGKQTGIYPFASPGGWQIIGRTDAKLFTPETETPTLLRAGDTVKFYRQKQ